MLFTEANLKNIVPTKTGSFKNIKTGMYYYYHYACAECGFPHLHRNKNLKFCTSKCSNTGKNNPMFGVKSPTFGMIGELSPNWKGGYATNNIPLYNTYTHQLEPIEKCVRDPEDPKILNVFCVHCGNQYRPTRTDVKSRIQYGINGVGTHRFYCSVKCKELCPIYHQKKYYKHDKPYQNNNRPDQLEWALKIKIRDSYICQICGKYGNIAHHIDPVVCNPIESCDIDNGITLCMRCHKQVHQLSGCTISELVHYGKQII
jgi:hypothetical protein